MSSAPTMDCHWRDSPKMTMSHINASTKLKLLVTVMGPGLSYLNAVVWKYSSRAPAHPMSNNSSHVFTPRGIVQVSINDSTILPITTTVAEYHMTTTGTGVVASLRRFMMDMALVMAPVVDSMIPNHLWS